MKQQDSSGKDKNFDRTGALGPWGAAGAQKAGATGQGADGGEPEGRRGLHHCGPL